MTTEKQKVIEYESGRPMYESELERLADEWKQLQKKNAQRKATLQMSTGIMINDEEDCTRVLDQQTQSIQELHQKQKVLEVRAPPSGLALLIDRAEAADDVLRSFIRINALISPPESSRRQRRSRSSPSRLVRWPLVLSSISPELLLELEMMAYIFSCYCRTMHAARTSR